MSSKKRRACLVANRGLNRLSHTPYTLHKMSLDVSFDLKTEHRAQRLDRAADYASCSEMQQSCVARIFLI